MFCCSHSSTDIYEFVKTLDGEKPEKFFDRPINQSNSARKLASAKLTVTRKQMHRCLDAHTRRAESDVSLL
jgi:hypothetical protein